MEKCGSGWVVGSTTLPNYFTNEVHNEVAVNLLYTQAGFNTGTAENHPNC